MAEGSWRSRMDRAFFSRRVRVLAIQNSSGDLKFHPSYQLARVLLQSPVFPRSQFGRDMAETPFALQRCRGSCRLPVRSWPHSCFPHLLSKALALWLSGSLAWLRFFCLTHHLCREGKLCFQFPFPFFPTILLPWKRQSYTNYLAREESSVLGAWQDSLKKGGTCKSTR